MKSNEISFDDFQKQCIENAKKEEKIRDLKQEIEKSKKEYEKLLTKYIVTLEKSKEVSTLKKELERTLEELQVTKDELKISNLLLVEAIEKINSKKKVDINCRWKKNNL